MLSIIVWCIAAVVGVLMAINGVFMLASPAAWSRLPGWMRAEGAMIEDHSCPN